MLVDFQSIDRLVRSQQDPVPFSGSIYLTQGEQVLFAQAYGYALRSERILNRVDTRFPSASGSKIFTALAVCQLVEQGRLSLDARLCELLTQQFPLFSPAITVRHLLTHTSGITSYYDERLTPDYEDLWQNLPVYRMRRTEDFLPLLQEKPMRFEPGERFEYNDGGYILLGAVIEQVSGLRFQEYIQENIFRPAHMVDAGYFAADQLPARTAQAYLRNPDGSWRSNIFAVPAVGAADGGAFTSALDWFQFWSSLRQNKLLGEQLTAELLQPQAATGEEAPNTHYGFGVWIHVEEGAVQKVSVSGYDPGVTMRSVVYPARDLVLTMLANTNGALWPVYRQIELALGL